MASLQAKPGGGGHSPAPSSRRAPPPKSARKNDPWLVRPRCGAQRPGRAGFCRLADSPAETFRPVICGVPSGGLAARLRGQPLAAGRSSRPRRFGLEGLGPRPGGSPQQAKNPSEPEAPGAFANHRQAAFPFAGDGKPRPLAPAAANLRVRLHRLPRLQPSRNETGGHGVLLESSSPFWRSGRSR